MNIDQAIEIPTIEAARPPQTSPFDDNDSQSRLQNSEREAMNVFHSSDTTATHLTATNLTNVYDQASDLYSPSTDVIGHFSGSSTSDLDSLFDPSTGLDWNDLFDANFEFSIPAFQGQLHVAAHTNADMSSQNYSQGSAANLFNMSASTNEYVASTNTGFPMATTDIQPPPYARREITESEVLEDAKFLLKHYRDVLIPQFAPLPTSSKSPWEILTWGGAVRTLADMTFLESPKVSHACKANLFAVVACAAYHTTKAELPFDVLFPARGEQILEYSASMAKKHLQDSLRLEASGPQRAKYKDQLMALFTLTALAVSSSLTKLQQLLTII
jgi:arginine metabolism regulation protein II